MVAAMYTPLLVVLLFLCASTFLSSGTKGAVQASVLPHAALDRDSIENSLLLRYITQLENDDDEDGSAARELCNVHTALKNVADAIEDLLKRKAAGLTTCLLANPIDESVIRFQRNKRRHHDSISKLLAAQRALSRRHRSRDAAAEATDAASGETNSETSTEN